jgi:hypothetical protein
LYTRPILPGQGEAGGIGDVFILESQVEAQPCPRHLQHGPLLGSPMPHQGPLRRLRGDMEDLRAGLVSGVCQGAAQQG